ncbi:MAG: DNA gyrase subunit A, partial [Clostridia bacterium]|nr:DNA gyrase subunit A [Clostridia bacterium]
MARAKGTQLTLNLENNVLEKSIELVMPESMMIYSEHIILDRSLPRVEDGLKPVQRRILYTMHNLKMGPQSEYKKSARIVGDCMGKYHPHGDSSIYGAMVRMAQDFNMRMPLVDGQGNFGTAMGDGPAAMRYTEARLEALTMELLRDIDKNTVSWSKNFDDTLDEPDILPGRFPNLLVNGATGIAIGFSMNIPPHNLTEVIDGCIALIDDPKMKLEELLTIIKGPDFPAGGFLLGGPDLHNMYATGQGKVVLRGRAEIENEGSSQNIVITEVPWGINPKEKIIKRIYELREKNKDLYGNVVDVFDESDGTGLRIVVKLKKGEDAVRVLDGLYKNTDLQCNYPVNMVAIADGKPRQLGLIPMLKYYLNYQKSVIYKRSKYDLGVAEKRAEVLEGYRIIMPNIDEVIAIIRGAATRAEAKGKLRERFALSDAQAEAILSLQLGNINKLDVKKFENELEELNKQIAELTKIIASDREQFKVVKKELQEIRDKYK